MAIFLNPACGSCSCTGSGVARVYAGGFFTNIGGSAKSMCALLDSDGNCVTSFTCELDDNAESMYLDEDNGILYMGGWFTTVNGVTHKAFVGVDWDTGAVVYAPTLASPFTGANPVVNSLNYDAVNGHLYVSGNFRTWAGTACGGSIRLTLGPSGGTLDTAWIPILNGEPQNSRRLGSTVYITGSGFTTINAATRGTAGAVDATTGTTTTAWNPDVRTGGARDVLPVSASSIFITGNFQRVNGAAGPLRSGLAETNASGTDTGWNPGAPILNGPSGRRLRTHTATNFLVCGNFVSAALSGYAYVASFTYTGAVDLGYDVNTATTGVTIDLAEVGPDNDVWIAGQNGVFKTNGGTGVIDTAFDSQANDRCMCFALSTTAP